MFLPRKSLMLTASVRQGNVPEYFIWQKQQLHKGSSGKQPNRQKGQLNILNDVHKVNPFCPGAVRFLWRQSVLTSDKNCRYEIIYWKDSYLFPKTAKLQTSLWEKKRSYLMMLLINKFTKCKLHCFLGVVIIRLLISFTVPCLFTMLC